MNAALTASFKNLIGQTAAAVEAQVLSVSLPTVDQRGSISLDTADGAQRVAAVIGNGAVATSRLGRHIVFFA
ncbi:MAG TPA: hypothetical protein VMA55_00690 [Acidovorax sp.]|nr:hypothetical protein [Acidovorax sp.]